MIKSCGSCQHWIKWKNNPKGMNKGFKSAGLCKLQDGRCPSDHVCDKWKGVKYRR